MKIEIYKEEETKENVLRLRLRQDVDKVTLIAVDKKGVRVDSGSILSITSEGEMHRNGSCRVVGIKTDYLGKIKIMVEHE